MQDLVREAEAAVDRVQERARRRRCREFQLHRNEDPSGISGTGVVAVGVILPSGAVVLEWLPAPGGQEFRKCLADIEVIHGHSGRTQIVFLDGETS